MDHGIRRDQFLGCLLGQAVADGVGAPYEGLPAEIVCRQCPGDSLLENAATSTLRYTDDTQMAIGVAETLVARGEIEETTLCEAFVRNFEDDRGYGAGARRIIQAMIYGDDWRSLARNCFPGGSFGNGAAMRAAPIGLMFFDDLDEAARQAEFSALPTHTHPLGIDGARIVAMATALAAREQTWSRRTFFQELAARAQTDELRSQLQEAATLKNSDSLSQFGSGIEAHRSVVTALCCFAGTPDSYPDVINRAIWQGGDTDTIAAIAGALSGAHLGLAAIPPELLASLEQGPKGGEFLRELAEQLYEASASRGG